MARRGVQPAGGGRSAVSRSCRRQWRAVQGPPPRRHRVIACPAGPGRWRVRRRAGIDRVRRSSGENTEQNSKPAGDAGSAEDDLRVVIPRRLGVPGRFILGHGLPARGFRHLAVVLLLPPHPERSKQFGFQSVLLQLSQVLNGKVLGADLTANLARV